jgi:TetR/AcrR family transcriptional repressor of nem operon
MARTKKITREEAALRARSAFWQHGYSHLTVRKLEEYTGINRFMLQTDFGGKDGLFMAAFKQYEQMVRTTQFNTIAAGTSADVLAFFEQQPTGEFSDEHRYGCLAANTFCEGHLQNKDIEQALEAFFLLMNNAFYAALQRDRDAGKLKTDVNITHAAEYLVTMAIGLSNIIRSRDSNLAGLGSVNMVCDSIRSWQL